MPQEVHALNFNLKWVGARFRSFKENGEVFNSHNFLSSRVVNFFLIVLIAFKALFALWIDWSMWGLH
jgi:hypothetical protein